MVRVLVALGFLLASLSPAAGQGKKDKKAPAPKLLCAVPLVARPGEKQKLTIRGKGLVAIKEVKVSGVEGAKVKVLGSKSIGAPNNAPAEKLGDSEVEIELELPKDAKPGAVKLMASGSNGESNAYTLLLRDSLTAVAEKEPNDGFEQAQAISIPCAIEGIIKNDRDVDVYKFKGKKGDKSTHRTAGGALRLAARSDRHGLRLESRDRRFSQQHDTNARPNLDREFTKGRHVPHLGDRRQ